MKHTVQSLRQSGHKVRVIHSRHLNFGPNATRKNKLNPPFITSLEMKERGIDKSDLAPRGGRTFIQVTTPSGQELCSEAICSLADNFNKKLGVEIALGRLNLN